MNKVTGLILSFLMAQGTLPPIAQAAEHSVRLDRATVSLDLSEGWQITEGLYGLELTILGPMEGESRPALSVTSMPHDESGLNLDVIAETPASYRAGKEKWLKKRSGKLLEITKPAKFTTAHCESGFKMGSEFALNLTPFVEQTYILRCGGKVYHLKSLVRAEIAGKFQAPLEKLVSSFRAKREK